MAGMYAVYSRAGRLKRGIAQRIRPYESSPPSGKLGFKVSPPPRFDTIRVWLGQKLASDVLKTAEAHRMSFRLIDGHTLGILA